MRAPSTLVVKGRWFERDESSIGVVTLAFVMAVDSRLCVGEYACCCFGSWGKRLGARRAVVLL